MILALTYQFFCDQSSITSLKLQIISAICLFDESTVQPAAYRQEESEGNYS